MNESLAGMLLKGLVRSLPEEKRELYEYIVKMEDTLAQRAATSEHFISLLIEHAPHKKAAAHFDCSYGEILKRMREIEEELDDQLHTRLSKAKWLNCTCAIRRKKEEANHRTALYLFMI
ncbi:hypothetical protein RRU94_07280 [Domibacillus sp. DTU_2020_1001157_1_SI_ALB_TIR_016]|uniref:hypothetical protein n=1 Tax=Domibacillus sp. DTU_2020_1001157_1_SI_ALB_TIR_016 TaxID=3077789 RepID=UPI0028EAF690|nr:hypothetical protein [Domibacillus sp. DTU_2020_1001157_1_SI_ALB_TIR_016]WNS78254.1 hypothetical protein RRU94_07280 [Domibacillus sp. DTU_2020_1001157_1_SI_ALB_TIR_016]